MVPLSCAASICGTAGHACASQLPAAVLAHPCQPPPPASAQPLPDLPIPTYQAKLFEYGGKKHVTYRALSKAVMGSKHRFAYQIVLIPQFVVIVGVGIANLILAGQCLQAVYELLCVGECSVNKYAWQLVAGLALMVVAQVC